jgi:hypothetical protein
VREIALLHVRQRGGVESRGRRRESRGRHGGVLLVLVREFRAEERVVVLLEPAPERILLHRLGGHDGAFGRDASVEARGDE